MVRVGLQISATLENVEELMTSHPDYPFFLRVTCTNCGEKSEKWHDITESERVQHDSRNPDGFNFYMKCKMCSREITIDIVEKSNVSYTSKDSGKFKTIVVFDCRGAEPFEFSPRTGWLVKSSDSGQQFENVDLSEDDWVEYDEKNKNSKNCPKLTKPLPYKTKSFAHPEAHTISLNRIVEDGILSIDGSIESSVMDE